MPGVVPFTLETMRAQAIIHGTIAPGRRTLFAALVLLCAAALWSAAFESCSEPSAPLVVQPRGCTLTVSRIVWFRHDWIASLLLAEATLFNPDSGHGVGGGNVALNGVPLGPYAEPTGGWTYKREWEFDEPGVVTFDGAWFPVVVEGAPGFGPLSDSIQTCAAPLVVTSPELDATISRASGFTLRWARAPGVQGDSLRLRIVDESSEYLSKRVADDGSAVVEGRDLARVPFGLVIVELTRSRGRVSTDRDGRRNACLARSIVYLEVQLTK